MKIKSNRQQLNIEQRAAAFCTENAVVAAGAGSGKTMVLANRFVWLLTEKDYKVDEILTLTFTKKAASQMFSRIYSLLTEFAEEETGVQAERARRALDGFIHARIQTLDSYSASIVRQGASRYGISPDFLIDQERCHKIAVEESLPFLITYRHHPAVVMLYSNNRPSNIARNIFSDILFNYCRIDKPIDFTGSIKIQFDIICTEWEKHSNELNSILKETEHIIFDNEALLPDLVPVMDRYRKGNIVIPKTSDIQKYFDHLLVLPVDSCIKSAESHPIQKAMTNILFYLYEIYRLKLNRGKRGDNQVKVNVKKIRVIFEGFSSLAVSCMQAGFIISIMPLFSELQDRYLNRKRAEGVLSFSDVASLSRTILLEQEDIRKNEKETFKAIMIDEFQDNNELQKDLLFLLAEKHEIFNKDIPPAKDMCPGKLFFVGDEKQSVYLFRGADVSVFRRLKNEIKSFDLPLKTNYRSSPSLIGAFNAIFGGSVFDPAGKMPLSQRHSVFAPDDETNTSSFPIYEASYTPLQAGADTTGKLTLCIMNKSEDGEETDDLLSVDENEARYVSEKIQSLLNEKTQTGGQKYKPSDIAILFRTRSPQHYFEKHLRFLGIPYTCEDINNFFYGGPVNDLLSVLRLAAHPLDSAAYAEMLRSPFAGLSLHGTALCLSIFTESQNPQAFNDEPLQILCKEDRLKYKHGQSIFSIICEKASKESISSIVSELWYNEGYRYETEWNPTVSVYRELYDYLFHLAVLADTENEGLASFTDSMRALRDCGGRLSEIDIPLERPNAVRLITIHKSKGLEFPVVFLCCCGKRSLADRSEEVFYSQKEGIVLSLPLPAALNSIPEIKNNFLWEQVKDETKRKRTAELRRLLYVGMTRAEKELYLTGSLELKEDKDTDGLSVKIKNYIEKKLEENENYIFGDSIIDNDTFFGLLLPSIASHIKQDGADTAKAFFNLEEIPIFTENYINNQEQKDSGLSNDKKGLIDYIKNAQTFYKKAQKIQTPDLRSNHITPVSLRSANEDIDPADSLPGRGFFINREFSGEKSDDIFDKVDSLLDKFSQGNDENTEKFNSGSFGTIAHICVEAHLNGKEPVIPSNIAGYLSPNEADAFLDAGRELAVRFVSSPLGKIAQKAKLRESEFSFRTIIKNRAKDEIFINGTVDLFFEDADSIHVVDFKTDSRETPSEHIPQMACYYQAVYTLFGLPVKKECRAWLYYLRTGHAVEVTEKVKQFNIEHRAFS